MFRAKVFQTLHIVFFINSIIFNLSRLFLALLAKTLHLGGGRPLSVRLRLTPLPFHRESLPQRGKQEKLQVSPKACRQTNMTSVLRDVALKSPSPTVSLKTYRKANIKSESKRRGETFAFPLASIFSFSFLITYYI